MQNMGGGFRRASSLIKKIPNFFGLYAEAAKKKFLKLKSNPSPSFSPGTPGAKTLINSMYVMMSWQIAILIIVEEKVNQDNQNDNEAWLKWVITIVGNCHFIMENSRVYENCKTTYSIVVNIRALIHVDYLTTNETTTTVNSQEILYVWNRYYSYIFIIEQNCM